MKAPEQGTFWRLPCSICFSQPNLFHRLITWNYDLSIENLIMRLLRVENLEQGKSVRGSSMTLWLDDYQNDYRNNSLQINFLFVLSIDLKLTSPGIICDSIIFWLKLLSVWPLWGRCVWEQMFWVLYLVRFEQGSRYDQKFWFRTSVHR